MKSFEDIRNKYPDWNPAYLDEWEKPTPEELERVQNTYNISYPKEFIDFQLTEGHLTPMGDIKNLKGKSLLSSSPLPLIYDIYSSLTVLQSNSGGTYKMYNLYGNSSDNHYDNMN
jgi:hypothetical protein